MTRHLLDPALDLVPLRRDGEVSRVRRFDALCGQSVGVLMVARGIPGQVVCPECLSIAAGMGQEVVV
jgi:hypothetical protein